MPLYVRASFCQLTANVTFRSLPGRTRSQPQRPLSDNGCASATTVVFLDAGGTSFSWQMK